MGTLHFHCLIACMYNVHGCNLLLVHAVHACNLLFVHVDTCMQYSVYMHVYCCLCMLIHGCVPTSVMFCSFTVQSFGEIVGGLFLQIVHTKCSWVIVW